MRLKNSSNNNMTSSEKSASSTAVSNSNNSSSGHEIILRGSPSKEVSKEVKAMEAEFEETKKRPCCVRDERNKDGCVSRYCDISIETMEASSSPGAKSNSAKSRSLIR